VHEAKILMSAVGGYTNAKYPRLHGIDKFKGPVVHTAKWDQTYDLEGRNVVIIGNGCEFINDEVAYHFTDLLGSASQVIPAIIDEVSSITQFIRVSQESSIYFQQDYFDHYLEPTILCSDAELLYKSSLADVVPIHTSIVDANSMGGLLDSGDSTYSVL
jgi:hypothetical protein